jgi:hypothetical protein
MKSPNMKDETSMSFLGDNPPKHEKNKKLFTPKLSICKKIII